MPQREGMDVETEYDRRFDDIDVESILARVERRPLTFVRRRCLYQGEYKCACRQVELTSINRR